MRHRGKGLWPVLSLIALLVLSACSPVTYRARGLFLNPLLADRMRDPDTAEVPLLLFTKRKIAPMEAPHVIVGQYARPPALGTLIEVCEILSKKTTAHRIVFRCHLFSADRSVLARMRYAHTLFLPDGRRVPGNVHVVEALRNHSVEISGAHSEPYMAVRDRSSGTVEVFNRISETYNSYPLFSKSFQVIFEDREILDRNTLYVELRIEGDQRRWSYTYDLTCDPQAALRWWINHMER